MQQFRNDKIIYLRKEFQCISQKTLLDRVIRHLELQLRGVQFNEYSIKEARIFLGVLQFCAVVFFLEVFSSPTLLSLTP